MKRSAMIGRRHNRPYISIRACEFVQFTNTGTWHFPRLLELAAKDFVAANPGAAPHESARLLPYAKTEAQRVAIERTKRNMTLR